MGRILDPFTIDTKYKKFIDIWFDDCKRLTYERLDFFPYNKNPCMNTNKNIKNTFEPFNRINKYKCENQIFIDSVKKLIFHLAEENLELADFLTKWIAHLIQYPDILPESVIVLKGNGGCGKDSLMELISRIVNNNNYILRTDKPEELFGTFNAALENKLIVAINEAQGSDAVKYLENMKNVVTATTINIHKKGKEIQTIKSYIRLIILSNNDKPICKNADDRRYCVMTTSDKLKQDASFFEPFYTGMQSESVLDSVFHYFNNIDLTDFKPNVFPDTTANEELIEDSIKPVIRYLYNICLNNPEGYFYDKNENLYINHKEFRLKFIEYCKEEGISFEYSSSPQKINMVLNKFKLYIQVNKQKKINYKNTRCHIINYKTLLEHLKTTYFKNHSDVWEDIEVKPVCVVDDDSSDDSYDFNFPY